MRFLSRTSNPLRCLLLSGDPLTIPFFLPRPPPAPAPTCPPPPSRPCWPLPAGSYLVSTDGFATSRKLEVYLLLGSLVLKVRAWGIANPCLANAHSGSKLYAGSLVPRPLVLARVDSCPATAPPPSGRLQPPRLLLRRPGPRHPLPALHERLGQRRRGRECH